MTERSGARPRRRPLGRALVDLYYRLRERRSTPGRLALSVGLGTWVGCLPLYGLHLVLCIGLARLLRLSAPVAYLAAHVNNPWTAPFLLYLEATVGHRLTRGRWLSLDPQAFRDAGGLALGRDLLLGAVVVGLVLGAALTVAAYGASRRFKPSEVRAQLVNRASRRYRELGLVAWETVRAKLRHDPVYLGILRSLELPEHGHLVDLGCGRGILLAAIRAAAELADEELWPADWPRPPRRLRLTGVEIDERAADLARSALAEAAEISVADLAAAPIPAADVATLLDVLHYLRRDRQDALVARVAAALRPGGSVVVREADAGGGARFLATRVQERLSSWARFEWTRRFHYRSAAEWRELLESHGLDVEVRPMAAGTPFANVLVVGRRGD